jgi:hypothetical protein
VRVKTLLPEADLPGPLPIKQETWPVLAAPAFHQLVAFGTELAQAHGVNAFGEARH